MIDPVLHRAYILHRRAYRETSLLVEAFTADCGRIGLVARGARTKRSSWRGLTEPLMPLYMAWRGSGDLVTMTQLEPRRAQPRPAPMLSGNALVAAFYVNELIVRVCHRHDPHPELFERYEAVLAELQDAAGFESSLRLFELDLLSAVGYGIILHEVLDTGLPVEPGQDYFYRLETGILSSAASDELDFPVSGNTLIALNDGRIDDPAALRQAKRLTRIALQPLLGGRPLQSRELWRKDARPVPSCKAPGSDDQAPC